MANLRNRQHAVNDRTPAGAELNELVGRVVTLNRHFTVVAEQLTAPSGQSLARWLVLGETRDGGATVAQIAARLKLARQSVQRVADTLVDAGLCAYEDNPRHRRAKLLVLRPEGREVLAAIDARQRAWADELGGRIGRDVLAEANAALETLLDRISRGDAAGR